MSHVAAPGGPFLPPGGVAPSVLSPTPGWSSRRLVFQAQQLWVFASTHVGQKQSPVCYSCCCNHATCLALPSASPTHLLLSTGFSLFPLFSLAVVPPLVAGPPFSEGAPWPELNCSPAGGGMDSGENLEPLGSPLNLAQKSQPWPHMNS